MPEHPPTPDLHTLRAESPTGELPSEVRGRILEALGITEERLERLRMIAQVVGGDFGMRVELGMPGGGSFFSPEGNRIQLDPLHLSEYVVAHEGGHRAITRGPKEIGLKPEKAAELYGKLGFAFGLNAGEDPADNDWWSRKYEGFRELPKAWYDGVFRSDAAMSVAEAEQTMGIPAIREMITAIGRVPRFVHFGNEINRLWHTGEFAASGLPDDVRAALERTTDAARDYFADIPSDHPSESDVVARARSRFRTFHDRIWPEMSRLVEEDLKDERLRQMVEESPPVSPPPAGGGARGGGEGRGGGEPSPLDDLPDDLKRELQEKIREAAERAAKGVEEAGEAEAGQAERDAETIRDAMAKLQQIAGDESKSADEREEAQKGLAGLEQALEGLQGKAQQARAQVKATANRLRSGELPQPVPLDQLSPELRHALEEAYAKIPPEVRAKLEAQARRALEALEDVLNADLEGKLTPDEDKPESHAERHGREEREAAERKRQETEAHEREEAERAITRALEQAKTPYDRAYEQVAPLIDRLTDDLERLFRKERNPRWKPGSPWSRIDLRKAMQFEADPSRYEDLGEHKTIPEKHDRTFTLLVDLSGSMQGEKIAETFKAAIVVAESLARVGMSVEILGFQDELIVFKDADEPMSDAVRSRMSGMLAEVINGNPGGLNHAEWNDDGYCLDRAVKRLQERPQREKFLIPLSDGQPAPSPAHAGKRWELAKIIAGIKNKGGVKLVGLGIGPGTEHVRTFYPNSVVEPVVTRLPESLAVLFEDMIIHPETY